MEFKAGTNSGVEGSTVIAQSAARRRKRAEQDQDLRYFLPKAGSSPAKPELGQEMASEGEALIEALKSGQPFFTLKAWKAVPEVNGGSPMIVKQAVART